jgi:hypothetical protein
MYCNLQKIDLLKPGEIFSFFSDDLNPWSNDYIVIQNYQNIIVLYSIQLLKVFSRPYSKDSTAFTYNMLF